MSRTILPAANSDLNKIFAKLNFGAFKRLSFRFLFFIAKTCKVTNIKLLAYNIEFATFLTIPNNDTYYYIILKICMLAYLADMF